MSAQRGLAQRRNGDWKLLQGRVSPDLYSRMQAAARLSGISFSLYLETVLESVQDDSGDFPIVHVSNYKQEELPIPTV